MNLPRVCAVALLLALVPVARAEDVKDSPYFPLKVGTKWEYKAAGQKYTLRVARHDKVGDAPCAVVEMVQDERVVATDYLGVTDDGVYRYVFNGQRAEPPVCILKLPPKKGATWKVDTKQGAEALKGTFTAGEEEVTVPAGKFKAVTAVLSDGTVSDVPFSCGYWFAEGVGVVKQTVKVADKEVVIELEKFEMGK